jgi:rare lipoprotein A
MKSNAILTCAFAGALLATTMSMAHSTERHGRFHSAYAGGHVHKRWTMAVRHYRVIHAAVAENRFHHRYHSYAARSGESAPAERAIGSSLLSGIASVYSGERTANGEFAAASGLTAAHRSLPFGTMVRVTHQQTGRSVVVRINDRGPFVRGRVIDLTPAAARAIGSSGLAPVTLTVVGHG